VSLLHDELVADKHSSGTLCKVCVYLKTLTPEERRDWKAEFDQPVDLIPNSVLLRALRRRGVVLGDTPVATHRRKRHEP
jgi:hypothetical protein